MELSNKLIVTCQDNSETELDDYWLIQHSKYYQRFVQEVASAQQPKKISLCTYAKPVVQLFIDITNKGELSVPVAIPELAQVSALAKLFECSLVQQIVSGQIPPKLSQPNLKIGELLQLLQVCLDVANKKHSALCVQMIKGMITNYQVKPGELNQIFAISVDKQLQDLEQAAFQSALSVMGNLKDAFHLWEESGDLQLSINDQLIDRKFCKLILMHQNKYFSEKISAEKSVRVINFDEPWNSISLIKVIEYIYVSSIQFPSIIEEVIQLYQIATKLRVEGLVEFLRNQIKSKMDSLNLFDYLDRVDQFTGFEQELVKCCSFLLVEDKFVILQMEETIKKLMSKQLSTRQRVIDIVIRFESSHRQCYLTAPQIMALATRLLNLSQVQQVIYLKKNILDLVWSEDQLEALTEMVSVPEEDSLLLQKILATNFQLARQEQRIKDLELAFKQANSNVQKQISDYHKDLMREFGQEKQQLVGQIERLNHEISGLRKQQKLLDSSYQLRINELSGSKLVTLSKDRERLLQWVKKGQSATQFNIIRLIYRGTQHGFSASSFHSQCDNVKNTLVIIKSVDSNQIFGGFTSLAWNQFSTYDQQAFLFNLTSQRMYEFSDITNAIVYKKSAGPIFGFGYDLYISNNCNTNKQSYSKLGVSYSFQSYAKYQQIEPTTELAGKSAFQVEEIEIYQID